MKYRGPVGAGVVLSFPTGRKSDEFANYVVTNGHVVANGGSIVRLGFNEPFFRPTTPDSWEHAVGDDLAICEVGSPITATGKNRDAYTDLLATDELLEYMEVGHGDDLFAMGSGGESNDWEPVMRFGNISSWPPQEMTDGRGMKVPLFLAEMRSRGGHSGSPIFLHLAGAGQLGAPAPHRTGWSLLGLACGHLTFSELATMTEDDVTKPIRLQTNTNTSLVIPAPRIRDLAERFHGSLYPTSSGLE